MAYRTLGEEPIKPKRKEAEENVPQPMLRHGARNIANIGSTIAGLPGDIAAVGSEYVVNPTKKLLGQETTPWAERDESKYLPGSQKIKETLREKTGGYLAPKNTTEQFWDDVVENTALLFTPGAQATRFFGTLRGAPKLINAFAKGLGAQVVGNEVKKFSGSESTGDMAKIGSMFMLSMLDRPSAMRQIGHLYEQAERSIPQGAVTSGQSLENAMNNLSHDITRGRPHGNLSPPEAFVVQQAENTRNLIQGGFIPVDQAMAQLRTINQHLENRLPGLPWRQRRGVRVRASQINGAINDTLRQYGRNNPLFAESFHPAQRATQAIHQSNHVANWVNRQIIKPGANETLYSLLGHSGVGKAVGGAALVGVPYQGVKLFERIVRSPFLRRIYGEAVGAAMRENSVQFNKKVAQLDEGLKKEKRRPTYRTLP